MRLGDLDALKKAACVKFYTTPYYKHILDLIDNAPTVNSRDKACEDCIYFDKPTTLEPCRHCTFAYKSCFKGKAKDERPQGELKQLQEVKNICEHWNDKSSSFVSACEAFEKILDVMKGGAK